MPEPREIAGDDELLQLMQEVEALRQELKALGQRLAEAERLADRDTLTPLLNRRAFAREVQRAIAIAHRHGVPASVIYFDLDDFKAINDCFGHAAGDAALRAVAERLAAQVRTSDAVARLGGDEFAVLLLHARQPEAAAKAYALHAAVTAAPAVCDGHAIPLKLTYGVREITAVESVEQALAEADAAMYLRKPGRM